MQYLLTEEEMADYKKFLADKTANKIILEDREKWKDKVKQDMLKILNTSGIDRIDFMGSGLQDLLQRISKLIKES